MAEERWVTVNGTHVLIGADGTPVNKNIQHATLKKDKTPVDYNDEKVVKKAYDVNPGYTGKGLNSINCTACVCAFEANMRGENTQALPFNEMKVDYNWKQTFGLKDSDGWGYSNRLDRQNVIKNIEMDMEDFGVGSRGIIEYRWNVVGQKNQMVQQHVINVVQTKSGTKFIDAQAGKQLPEKEILQHYVRGSAALYRTDDKAMDKDMAKKAIKNR